MKSCCEFIERKYIRVYIQWAKINLIVLMFCVNYHLIVNNRFCFIFYENWVDIQSNCAHQFKCSKDSRHRSFHELSHRYFFHVTKIIIVNENSIYENTSKNVIKEEVRDLYQKKNKFYSFWKRKRDIHHDRRKN